MKWTAKGYPYWREMFKIVDQDDNIVAFYPREDDARLGALAPEMREALDLALSCFVGMGFGKCEAAQKARAVLSKLEEHS